MRASALFAVVVMASACHRDLTRGACADDDDSCRGRVDDAAADAADPGDASLLDSEDTVSDASGTETAETMVEDVADVEATPGDSGSDTSPDASVDAPLTDSMRDAAACVTGTHVCGGAEGRSLLRCESDAGMTVVVTCPSATTCDAAAKRCTACVPDAYGCSGASRTKCDSFGATASTVASCATPELCASSVGAICSTPACSVGEKMCVDPRTLHVCNSGRTEFTATTCRAGCGDGACLKVLALAAHPTATDVCALLSNGTIRCWGAYAATPVAVAGITSAVQVTVQGTRIGARLADSTVRVWMNGGGGGPEAPGTASPVPGVAGAEDIALGTGHACVRVAGGAVKCWGMGGNGELGGGGTPAEVWPPSLVTATGVVAVGPLAIGGAHTLVVVSGGARGWGLDDGGQLGTGALGNRLVPVATFAGAMQLSASQGTTCARTSAAGAVCSGHGGAGQLGDGAKVDRLSPVAVVGLAGLVDSIAVGGRHACALLTDKTVRCWGANGSGQLGNGTTAEALAPVAVTGLTSVQQVAAAENTTCALLTDGETVKCWGHRSLLGTSASSDASTPVTVAF